MSRVAALLLGALLGSIATVLVALAGDPREKRGVVRNFKNVLVPDDTTSLDRQSRRFDDEMDGVQGDPYPEKFRIERGVFGGGTLEWSREPMQWRIVTNTNTTTTKES